MKYWLTIVLFFYILDLNGQCAGNLLANGSFTSPEGEIVTAAGWEGESTPDVNDAVGLLNTSPGYVWTGTPLPSSDGGTWQNVFSEAEKILQPLNVTSGQSYSLHFEYAAQGIYSESFTYTNPVGIHIYIDDVLVATTPPDPTQYSWENFCYTFTAPSNNFILSFSASLEAYAGIDGICLLPIQPVDLGNDTTLCLGDALLLNATSSSANGYLWQDLSTDPFYNVTQQGLYIVEIAIENCGGLTDSIKISMVNCHSALEMPNVFTPDDDGVNDFFHPKEMVNISQANLKIFNRWGQLIYETDNLSVGWDGKFKDVECTDGTYFWMVDYTTNENQHLSISGFLHLI